mmetsp:Transcript_83817/g.236902  ORF Transcript_83817/g.236902 Transcript_83817/m.236902 type:complete len:103 (+) Transcript_83817:1659-1967(+)
MRDLIEVLRAELASGQPSPVPTWYRFDMKRPGLRYCSNPTCFNTETEATKFCPCSRCKLVKYCGTACQKKSWNASHKQLCVALKVEQHRTPGDKALQKAFGS